MKSLKQFFIDEWHESSLAMRPGWLTLVKGIILFIIGHTMAWMDFHVFRIQSETLFVRIFYATIDFAVNAAAILYIALALMLYYLCRFQQASEKKAGR